MDVTVTPRMWAAGSIPSVTVVDGPPGGRALLHVDRHVVWTGVLDDDGQAAVPALRVLGLLRVGSYRLGVRVPAAWPQAAARATVTVRVTDDGRAD